MSRQNFTSSDCICLPLSYWEDELGKGSHTFYHNAIAKETSIMEAIFVQRFIFFWKKFKRVGKGMMFIIPQKFVEPIGMNVSMFRTIVKKWEKLGIIKTILKGMPLKKWYQLDEDRFADYLSSFFHISPSYKNKHPSYKNLELKGTKIYKIYSIKNIKENNTVGSSETLEHNGVGSSLFSDKPKASFSSRMAKRLYVLLNKHHKIAGRVHLPSWASQLTRWRNECPNGILKKRFKAALNWYEGHIGEQYTPHVSCMNSFIKKFSSIEAAMVREAQRNGIPQDIQEPEEPATKTKEPCEFCKEKKKNVYTKKDPLDPMSDMWVHICDSCYNKRDKKSRGF